jgi:hypothetical protein
MPDDVSAVMETPDAGAAVETEVTTDVNTSTDTGESGQSTEVDNGDQPQEGETGHLRGTELYKAIKQKLKAAGLSPQEQKSIRNAIFIAGKADQATGGDLTAFERERALFAQLGDPSSGETPEQIVQNVKDKLSFWDDFDSKWEKGDTSLVEMMAESNPASFQNVSMAAMDKLSTLNNDAYSNYISKAAFNYLADQDIPLQLSIASRFLPESSQDPALQAVIDAFKAVNGAVNGIKAMASKKIETKQPERAQEQPNPNQSLEQRELSVRNYEWSQEAKTPNLKLRDMEMQSAATARKVTLTDEEKSKINTAVKEEYEARLAANRNYGEAMRGYLQAGNRKAYADRAASEGKKLLPSIVARHTNAVLDARKSAAAQPKPAAGAKPTNGAQPRQDATGTAWLNGSPATMGLQVDYDRTSRPMFMRGEAYIKGKKELHKWKVKTGLTQ